MASYDYDLFVIGAGSGGTRASRIAAGYGARVAVAEEACCCGVRALPAATDRDLNLWGIYY